MKSTEYILHVLGEIAHYVLQSNPSRMVISLHRETDGLHLCVVDSCERSDEELATMTAALNAAKRPEMGGYYGAMCGTDLVGEARLNLIGWQIKKADVSRADSGTKIDLWVGGDRFDPDKFSIPKE